MYEEIAFVFIIPSVSAYRISDGPPRQNKKDLLLVWVAFALPIPVSYKSKSSAALPQISSSSSFMMDNNYFERYSVRC